MCNFCTYCIPIEFSGNSGELNLLAIKEGGLYVGYSGTRESVGGGSAIMSEHTRPTLYYGKWLCCVYGKDSKYPRFESRR